MADVMHYLFLFGWMKLGLIKEIRSGMKYSSSCSWKTLEVIVFLQ